MKFRMSHRKTGIVGLLAAAALWLAPALSYAIEEPPFELPPPREIAKLRTAVIETDRGDILIELFPETAPWHVANLKYLADKDFFRNRTFSIHHPEYIIQGGGRIVNGKEEVNYALPGEFSDLKHEAGVVGMARRPDPVNSQRLSSPTQIHILLRTARHMDGAYTIFGRVFRGMDIVRKLRRGDAIRNVKVFVRN